MPTLCMSDLLAIFDLEELAISGPRLLIVDHRPAQALPQSPDHRPGRSARAAR